ncbi:MAG: TonB-dependent receptor plug domain-containing protein [Saprospiraceae bacterium]|nr:TonB-dependent receptor plug domain-containing protein [Saprospiraceae bacterium]
MKELSSLEVPFGLVNLQSQNGLASPNIRGLGFERTSVLWNGIPINSPANGGLDYSLLPGQMGNDIKFYPGGSAALAGSGAFAGTLTINGNPFNAQNRLRFQLNSFGDTQENLQLAWKKESYAGSMKVSGFQSTSSYTFKTDQGKQTRENTSAQIYHLFSDHSFRLKKGLLSAHVWANFADREIPAPITGAYQGDKQYDNNFRTVINHQTQLKAGNLSTRIGGLRERIHYVNNLFEGTPTVVYRGFLRSSLTKRLAGETQLILGINALQDWSSSYGDTLERFTTLAATGTLKKSWKENQELSLAIRQQVRLDGDKPITGSLEYFQKKTKYELLIRASRDFRQPTLNELFWSSPMSTGNPDLNSESGWTQELAVKFKIIDTGKNILSLSTRIFSTNVKDWILWEFSEVWSPRNVREVWSRGIHLGADWNSDSGSLNWELRTAYSLNPVSENRDAGLSLKEEQLIRSPLHQGSGQMRITYKKITFDYSHNWMGERNMLPEGFQVLDNMSWADLGLTWDLNKSLQTRLDLNNIWNDHLEHLPGLALPGSHLQVSVLYIP